MLLNDIYTVSSFDLSGDQDTITCRILLNRKHPVFDGHFPGNPVMPGVCTVHIIRELLEKALDRDLMLARAGTIKYLGFISPLRTPEFVVAIHYKHTETGSIGCSAVITAGEKTLFSFKGEYLFLHPESSSRMQQ